MIAAVIGANFGDEGKGAVVDYLSTTDTLVVRHNGGAQAGHTVVTPDGLRHEFHHFGAGTFRGARTLLSRFFVVNPMIFREEWGELKALGVTPNVTVDPLAEVATPWDALLNQAVERKRGEARHGSCGIGINEAVTRGSRGYPLLMGTCWDASPVRLIDAVHQIVFDYVPMRANELGVTLPDYDVADYVARFIGDVHLLASRLARVADATALIAGAREALVFEGAQGLRLDEVRGRFPHVTRSRTGLTNVAALLREAGLQNERLDAYYVTRTYVTRHGAGPLRGETSGHPFGWAGPETNVEGEWQGRLRYASLRVTELDAAVVDDLAEARLAAAYPRYAVTCVDQVPDGRAWVRDRFALSDVPVQLAANGPTREDVVEWARKEMTV